MGSIVRSRGFRRRGYNRAFPGKAQGGIALPGDSRIKRQQPQYPQPVLVVDTQADNCQ